VINQRLFDWYGIDTKKNLGLKTFCPRPFDTVLIDKNGSCFACECTAWLPQSVGNLNLQSLENILNSPLKKQLQESIIDGSYRYCNNKQCSWLLDNRPETKVWTGEIPINKIKNIRLAIDDSCNLRCPSCRTNTVFVKSGKLLQQRMLLAKRVIEYISSQSHKIALHVGSDGDPFASLVYRYLIKQTKNFPHVSFSIQTNGLLVKKMYQRHEDMFKKLSVLNVSIDGASKETYETLRKGGSFKKIIENLEFIKKIKLKLNFKFIIHFVTQAENYKEMPAIIELAEKYSADHVWLNKITNWNTFPNFEEKNIMNSSHKNYNDFINVLNIVREEIKKHSNKFIEMPTLDTL
jgi:sulfatase maturation enzyme AslB (radical SAM superfamily)